MTLRIEHNPTLAVQIMQRAGARMERIKGDKIPRSWHADQLDIDTIIDDYDVSPDEFLVIYDDDKPIAAAVLQHGDKTKWASWPTQKDALYGYRYAGNPDYPMFKTPIIFDALKKYATSIGVPVIRIDIGEWELGKKRLYESQGFKTVGISSDGDSTERFLLLEYDPQDNPTDI